MKRIDTLDYLRGAMATLIMCYHFLFWSGFHFTAADFFGKIGIYGVSVFYVLSGITLYVVYNNRIGNNFKSIASFAVKRIFRIFPLLWFITICTVIIEKQHFDAYRIFINLTGIFGFIQPDAYIGNGVWSIGNELVFYAFFPFIILLSNYNKYLFLFFSSILVATGIYFAFVCLTPADTLGAQWKTYVNPFNQIILFAGGILIAYFIQPNSFVKHKLILRLLLLLLAAAFVFYPVSGDVINIVSGINRVVFCALVFVVCGCILSDDYNFPKLIHKSLSFIGETSYSIYLVHPIVYVVISNLSKKHFPLHYSIIVTVSIVLTFIASFFIYRWIEKPMVNVGKKVSLKYFNS